MKVDLLMEWIDEDLIHQAGETLLREALPLGKVVTDERGGFKEIVSILHHALEPFGEQEKPWGEYFRTAEAALEAKKII